MWSTEMELLSSSYVLEGWKKLAHRGYFKFCMRRETKVRLQILKMENDKGTEKHADPEVVFPS